LTIQTTYGKAKRKRLIEKWEDNDEYTEQLEKLINAKAKGKAHLIKQATKAPKQTQDLVAALKASLARPSPVKSTKK
jgi:non-homologous end joining protein Ku